MIVLTREQARRFRAVAARCAGRPKGPAPPVAISIEDVCLSLRADGSEVSVEAKFPTTTGSGRVIVSMAVLETIANVKAECVQLYAAGAGRGVARWSEAGTLREHPFETIRPTKSLASPCRPEVWSDPQDGFLAALHEASRTAGRESARFATRRIQIVGGTGQVIATDCKQALVQGGYSFPFPERVLVPAVPVFGVKELAANAVRVGRTATHLVVAAGPWTVWLKIDADGRFPDVLSVVPKSTRTTLTIGACDAAGLAERLKRLPGAEDKDGPITLDLQTSAVRLRAKSEAAGEVIEVVLTDSTATGPPLQVAVNRSNIQRLLALGFRTLRFAGLDKPFVAADTTRTFLATVLDADAIVPTAAGIPSNTTGTAPDSLVTPIPLRDTPPMKPETNGRHLPPSTAKPETNGRHPPPPTDDIVIDPLAEAEALRASLADAALRAGRLVTALKARRKEQRALSQVFTSLKSLSLGP